MSNEDTDPDNLLNDDSVDTTDTAMVGRHDDATTVRYHPIRGVLYGLLIGIGLAIYLITFKVINLSIVLPVIVIVICMAAGGVWGRFGPAKQPAG